MAASEAVPYAKTGGLADVAGSLPSALAELGVEVTLALPFYKEVGLLATGSVTVRGEETPVSYHQPPGSLAGGVRTVLVRNDKYFWRDRLYGYADDAERFAFFARAVAELPRALDWQPQVIHCNDWQTALVPLYLRLMAEKEPALAGIGTLFTIHNLAYQGVFPAEAMQVAGLPWDLFTMEALEFYGQMNFLKAGIVFSDLINTVSPTYAKEIQTAEYGERLEGLLSKRADRLHGILNGIDTAYWDPRSDKYLAQAYNANTAQKGKAANKKVLQERVGLPVADVPVLGAVARLARQKGFDLVCEALPNLLKQGFQCVVLGLGEEDIQRQLQKCAERWPKQVKTWFRFDEPMAHLVYAASDLFLMPSRYEPCGLGQMIAFRYGAIPVVHKTGGLADTVEPFDRAKGRGNGFVFDQPTPEAFARAVSEALEAYADREAWAKLVRRVMRIDHSWRSSATQYLELYRSIVEEERARS